VHVVLARMYVCGVCVCVCVCVCACALVCAGAWAVPAHFSLGAGQYVGLSAQWLHPDSAGVWRRHSAGAWHRQPLLPVASVSPWVPGPGSLVPASVPALPGPYSRRAPLVAGVSHKAGYSFSAGCAAPSLQPALPCSPHKFSEHGCCVYVSDHSYRLDSNRNTPPFAHSIMQPPCAQHPTTLCLQCKHTAVLAHSPLPGACWHEATPLLLRACACRCL